MHDGKSSPSRLRKQHGSAQTTDAVDLQCILKPHEKDEIFHEVLSRRRANLNLKPTTVKITSGGEVKTAISSSRYNQIQTLPSFRNVKQFGAPKSSFSFPSPTLSSLSPSGALAKQLDNKGHKGDIGDKGNSQSPAAKSQSHPSTLVDQAGGLVGHIISMTRRLSTSQRRTDEEAPSVGQEN